jgi:hypothetical protein
MKVPWVGVPLTFRGNPFVGGMEDGYAGFVYIITMPDGKRYVGKKFFAGMRKQAGKKRRAKVVSNWEVYFSSSEFINTYIKANGVEGVKREIISLHTLKRDVNFCEIMYQYQHNVLDAMDEQGNRLWVNENIQGKYFPGLVIGWRDRSVLA